MKRKYKLTLNRVKKTSENIHTLSHSTPVKKRRKEADFILSPIKTILDIDDIPTHHEHEETVFNQTCSLHDDPVEISILCHKCGKCVKTQCSFHDTSVDRVCAKCGILVDGDFCDFTTVDGVTNESLQCSDSSSTNLIDLLAKAQEKLALCGKSKFLESLLSAVISGRLDTEGLTFQIISETVQALTIDSLSQIRYSWQSKCFWKLFLSKCGGLAIRLLMGWKCTGSLLSASNEAGTFYPDSEDVILAIPGEDILRRFDPYNGEWPSKIPPGFCSALASPLSKAVNNTSVCLSLDGKKITPGLSGDRGDINLLGMEADGMTLQKARDKFTNQQEKITHAIERTQSSVNPQVDKTLESLLKWSLTLLSKQSIEIDEEVRKKNYCLDKLKTMGGEQYNTSRYCFVIQQVTALLVELQHSKTSGHDLRDNITMLLISLHDATNFLLPSPVHMKHAENFHALHDIDLLLQSTNPEHQQFASFIQNHGPQYVKQRSTPWFELRKKVHVTGSTLHAATGAAGSKAQKEHFLQTVRGKDRPTFSPQVQQAMDHGTENEINAVATLCTRFLPCFFPQLELYEVGCFPVDMDGVKMLVSPDGALYDSMTGDIVAAVEIKCPYTASLHSGLPARYYLQVQAEMVALDVSFALFVSYKEESMRIYKVVFDGEVWDLVKKCLKETFGNGCTKIPNKLTQASKLLSEKIKTAASSNCELLGQVSTVKAVVSIQKYDILPPMKTRIDPEASALQQIEHLPFAAVDSVQLFEMLYAHNSKLHQLLRKKATEVITMVASDTDRIWTKNQVIGTPLCYFLKGYSLSMDVMRAILEDTLDKIYQAGIHVPCIAFDGQFVKLLRESKTGSPQTLLQTQKKFWGEVTSISKPALVSHLRAAGTVKLDELSIEASEIHPHQIVVERKQQSSLPQTCLKHVRNESNSSNSTVTIPDDNPGGRTAIAIPEPSEGSDHADVTQVMLEDVEELLADPSMNDTNNVSPLEPVADDSSSMPGVDSSKIWTPPRTAAAFFSETQLTLLYTDLCINHKLWNKKSRSDVETMVENCTNLSKLTLPELKTLGRFLKLQMNVNILLSCSKTELLLRLKTILGLEGNVKCKPRKRNVACLRDLAARFLQGPGYSKMALNVSYAQWKFPERVDQWRESSHVKHGMIIPEMNTSRQMNWFYVPEYSPTRKQIEVRKIDTHHLLTRHRSAICKGDVGLAKRDHFFEVARENTTSLKPGMMEQQLNMQSTDYALITFSEKVQKQLEGKGYMQSAILCKHVREWFEASDSPGIPAVERCQRKLRYQDYLLSLRNLRVFPPPGSHIMGYPLPLWESTISAIDADFFMYEMSKRRTYNNRALSSQPCESLYSCLATMPGAKNGVPSCTDLEINMAKICGECVVRQDPTRGFAARLSSAPVYPQILMEKEVGELPSPMCPPQFIKQITLKDHLFDAASRRRRARREPKGISSPHKPGKGGAGIRQYHKVDESKLNPMIRAGIPLQY